jgi:hypothetical protein
VDGAGCSAWHGMVSRDASFHAARMLYIALVTFMGVCSVL